ncbi:aldehyde dehydrogenase family protein [Paenibacillus sp. E222]|uniref:aldehyde dehydrogenase family protein n=1 Tax=Paenibacillus sp. E222 TaxID=2748863 RepID=UPI00359C2E56
MVNSGQTCVALDYVLVHELVKVELISELILTIKQFFGSEIVKSCDYGRIVSARHFNRLKCLH